MELKDIKGIFFDKRSKEQVTIESIEKDKQHPNDPDYWVIYYKGGTKRSARAWAFGVGHQASENIYYIRDKEGNVRRILDKIK